MRAFFKGFNGTITLEDEQLTIKKGLFSGNCTNIYNLSDVLSVRIKKLGLERGYLEIVSAGDQREFTERMQQPNVVYLKMSQDTEAEKFKNLIDEALRSVKSAHSSVPAQLSTADEIAKFKQLLDDGAITQQEYEAKKKQLLGL